MSYSSPLLPSEVMQIHWWRQGWVVKHNHSLVNVAELGSLQQKWGEGRVVGRDSVNSHVLNIYGHIYGIVVNFASCFNCLALALMSRDISAPEMGRSALFYFQTNKSSPHTHVLVYLVLDCLVWKEPEEESLVKGTWKYIPVNILVGKYRTDEIQC